ncbi:Uncharacterized protein PBTT_06956 [Plasmodiophora brassicae]
MAPKTYVVASALAIAMYASAVLSTDNINVDHARIRRSVSARQSTRTATDYVRDAGTETGPAWLSPPRWLSRDFPSATSSSSRSSSFVTFTKRTWSTIKRALRSNQPDRYLPNSFVPVQHSCHSASPFRNLVPPSSSEEYYSRTRGDATCAQASSSDGSAHRNPFQDVVPHPAVRLLIRTIEFEAASLHPAGALRDSFRSSYYPSKFMNVANELEKLANYDSDKLPNAGQADTKRDAMFLLKRWFRDAASNGHPLFPDAFVSCVSEQIEARGVDDPFTKCSLELDRGRRRVMKLLRGLAQKLIGLQSKSQLENRLTFVEFASSLAPYIVAESCAELIRGTSYAGRLFLPEFAKWLEALK